MQREPRRRRRPALSCVECRRRKIKCDRSDPCAHCVAAQVQCRFRIFSDQATVQQQNSASFSPIQLPLPPVHSQFVGDTQPAIGEITHPTSSTHQASPSTAVSQHAAQDASAHTQLQNNSPGGEARITDLLFRIQKLEESAASRSTHAQLQSLGDKSIGATPSASQDSRLVLNKTRLGKWSHSMSETKEFAPMWECYCAAIGEGQEPRFHRGELGALVSQMGDLLQKCKNIARTVKKGRPSRLLSAPGFGLSPPPRETADAMATLYFQSFESTYRILHVPTFWAEYKRFWDNPESTTTAMRLKILLVVGIGSALDCQGDGDSGVRKMALPWVYAAQTWLSGPLEKDRLNITGIQINCLTILARQIFSIGGDLVWTSMGSLVHRAMQIGLHHDPKHFKGMPVFRAELRRRLWATIMEMLMQSSLDPAMPPRISLDEFDTQPPANINDEEMDDSTTTIQPHPSSKYTSTSIQLILHDSMPTRLRILQLLNNFKQELSYTDVLALSAEITEACRRYNNFINNTEGGSITTFHRNLLDYLIRRFLIPLHCAFTSHAGANPIFYSSLKVSIDTAMTIISPEPDEKFSRLMAVGGGMFREGLRYASTIIGFDLLSQVETQRLDGTLRRNSQHREVLKNAVKNMISLSAERIRQGETNVKSHMFLSMTLAQVEAIEAGIEYETKMAQSAVSSLEFCHDLLQTRAVTASSVCSSTTDLVSTNPETELGPNFDWGLELFFPVEFYS